MEKKIKIGDVVRLKSGSPSFVVISDVSVNDTVSINYWNESTVQIDTRNGVSINGLEIAPEAPSFSI